MDMPFDIKRVQDRLFAMAKTIATILEKNDIPYEIAFGTLLGAVRHGGFILNDRCRSIFDNSK